jgi:hypothetical protein
LRCLASTRNQNKHNSRDQPRDGGRSENPRISPFRLAYGFAALARVLSGHGSSMPTHPLSNYPPVVEAISEGQSNNGNPDLILFPPKGWAVLRKLRVGTGRNDSLLGAGADLE